MHVKSIDGVIFSICIYIYNMNARFDVPAYKLDISSLNSCYVNESVWRFEFVHGVSVVGVVVGMVWIQGTIRSVNVDSLTLDDGTGYVTAVNLSKVPGGVVWARAGNVSSLYRLFYVKSTFVQNK